MPTSGSHWKKLVFAVAIYSVAMAYLESAVVVYLRSMYYPLGFSFPLKVMPLEILRIEIFREVATIVMLAAVAWIAGAGFNSRFAFFSFAFGIWDIFYYGFLKITLNWPASLMDQDILFLIPRPWIAPVIAPLLVSAVLVGCSVLVVRREFAGPRVEISLVHWFFMILGGAIVIASFLLDIGAELQYPVFTIYSWIVFACGMTIALFSFTFALRR